MTDTRLKVNCENCLLFQVLANMLMKSGINPFDSQEAKPYKNDPEILAMTNLVRCASMLQFILYLFINHAICS